MAPAAQPDLIPAKPSAWFFRFFSNYSRRLMGKRFNAVRIASGTERVLAGLDARDGPAIVLLSHSSWWDPLLSLVLAHGLTPRRTHGAPMDREQLSKFGIFRKVGIFGIDPDDPVSMRAMLDYVAAWFGREARPTLWITPQGRFTDVRDPVVIRPGAAALAARTRPAAVVSCAIEYGFWQDQRPECFVRLAEVPPPGASPSTADWHRVMGPAMQANGDALAGLVRAREAPAFTCLVGGGGGRINPVYDLWLKLRGRSGVIAARRAASGAVGSPKSHGVDG
ncbi:MAG: lysophospholipid acyltransferase family protein [Phycisphaerales bacterium]|nr:lysophospholipid acyltransferase family protein [Phycisphaerales bacterium]